MDRRDEAIGGAIIVLVMPRVEIDRAGDLISLDLTDNLGSGCRVPVLELPVEVDPRGWNDETRAPGRPICPCRIRCRPSWCGLSHEDILRPLVHSRLWRASCIPNGGGTYD